jgi:hypothetical protein
MKVMQGEIAEIQCNSRAENAGSTQSSNKSWGGNVETRQEQKGNSPLGKVPSLHPMHCRPSANITFFPMTILESVTSWILEPSDMTTFWIAFQHEWTVIMANDNIHKTIASNVNNSDCDR